MQKLFGIYFVIYVVIDQWFSEYEFGLFVILIITSIQIKIYWILNFIHCNSYQILKFLSLSMKKYGIDFFVQSTLVIYNSVVVLILIHLNFYLHYDVTLYLEYKGLAVFSYKLRVSIPHYQSAVCLD